MTFFPCVLKQLPPELAHQAALTAIMQSPVNAPARGLSAPHLALDTSKWWGAGGVNLTVGFMEPTPQDLRDRILSHANAWGAFCNVKFRWSTSTPNIRISRGQGGYYSYLGTDNLHVPRNEQTMNLEAFTLSTPESEYRRVVRHEFGHALGWPHEHMRKQLVARIDPVKAKAYFLQMDGWDAKTVEQQVLTPLDDNTLRETPEADQDSIMCYQLPGSITTDGQPIRGGVDIDPTDGSFAALIYPGAVAPPPPPPPMVGAVSLLWPDGTTTLMAPGKYTVAKAL